MMSVWLLKLRPGNGHEKSPYDKTFGFLIRARNAKAARRIAQANGGDECNGDRIPWLSPAHSTCRNTCNMRTGKAGVLLVDNHAG